MEIFLIIFYSILCIIVYSVNLHMAVTLFLIFYHYKKHLDKESGVYTSVLPFFPLLGVHLQSKFLGMGLLNEKSILILLLETVQFPSKGTTIFLFSPVMNKYLFPLRLSNGSFNLCFLLKVKLSIFLHV